MRLPVSHTNCFFFSPHRCFDDGEVLMCDWKACPKVYHLACLGREKMPREKWYCPWHHCVECGKPAVSHCIHCPNAYCKSHGDALNDHPELGKICDEHKDDLTDLIKFYRKVGGIQHLATNPNVLPIATTPNAPAKTKIIEKIVEGPGDIVQEKVKRGPGRPPRDKTITPGPRVKTTTSGKENSNQAAIPLRKTPELLKSPLLVIKPISRLSSYRF